MSYLRTLLFGAFCGCIFTMQADDGTFYRLELGAGLGAGFGLTDVNARFYGHTNWSAALIARVPLNPRMAVKISAGYTPLKGNTTGLKEFYPATPDAGGKDKLHFTANAPLYDLCGIYELHFLPYGFVKDFRGFQRIVPFMQLGAGVTYSPEGKAFTLNLPIGVGVKYKIGRRFNVAIDWTMHFTPSDRLEGLSAPKGISSSAFRNKDHYSQTLITFTYDLAPTCPTCNKAE